MNLSSVVNLDFNLDFVRLISDEALTTPGLTDSWFEITGTTHCHFKGLQIVFFRDYILIANFLVMVLLPFVFLALLNYKLFRAIKVGFIFKGVGHWYLTQIDLPTHPSTPQWGLVIKVGAIFKGEHNLDLLAPFLGSDNTLSFKRIEQTNFAKHLM